MRVISWSVGRDLSVSAPRWIPLGRNALETALHLGPRIFFGLLSSAAVVDLFQLLEEVGIVVHIAISHVSQQTIRVLRKQVLLFIFWLWRLRLQGGILLLKDNASEDERVRKPTLNGSCSLFCPLAEIGDFCCIDEGPGP